jgi:hypothetical protein
MPRPSEPDPRLVEQARASAGLPADASVSAIVRYALAKLAGLSDAIAATVARLAKQPDGGS